MSNTINPPLEGRQYHYKSIAEIKQKTVKDLVNENNRKHWERILEDDKEKTRSNASSWFGPRITDYQQLQNALNRGWGYGLKKVNEMTAKIKLPQLESVKRKTFKGREGDFLDIHKVNRGEFDRAWSRRKRASKATKKSITLAVCIGANWTVNADRLFWRGIATTSLAKALVTAGHSVEIVAYTGLRDLTYEVNGPTDSSKFFYTFMVKPFEMPINLSSLVSTICCAGFFRTEVFKAFLTDPKNCHLNLGCALGDKLPDEVLKRNGQTVQVPNNLETSEKCQAWLNKIVNEI